MLLWIGTLSMDYNFPQIGPNLLFIAVFIGCIGSEHCHRSPTSYPLDIICCLCVFSFKWRNLHVLRVREQFSCYTRAKSKAHMFDVCPTLYIFIIGGVLWLLIHWIYFVSFISVQVQRLTGTFTYRSRQVTANALLSVFRFHYRDCGVGSGTRLP